MQKEKKNYNNLLLQLCQGTTYEFVPRFHHLRKTGWLKETLPEIDALYGRETRQGVSHKENFGHTLQVIANCARLSDNPWMRVVGLLHDIGKPSTKRFKKGKWTFHGHETVGKKMVDQMWLKYDMDPDMLQWVQDVIFYSGKAKEVAGYHVTDSAIRRYAKILGNNKELIDDVLCFAKCDITTSSKERFDRYTNAFERLGQRIRRIWREDEEARWRMSVNGHMLMSHLDIGPEKLLGRIKSQLEREVKSGVLQDDVGVILKRSEELKKQYEK